MLKQNKFGLITKTVAGFLTLALMLPSPAYSNRPVGVARVPDILERLSKELISTLPPGRSESLNYRSQTHALDFELNKPLTVNGWEITVTQISPGEIYLAVAGLAPNRSELRMLVLSRQRGESIIIGDNIVVTVVGIRGDKVRLGIQAPHEIPVHRQEVHEAIQREAEAEATLRRIIDQLFENESNTQDFEQAISQLINEQNNEAPDKKGFVIAVLSGYLTPDVASSSRSPEELSKIYIALARLKNPPAAGSGPAETRSELRRDTRRRDTSRTAAYMYRLNISAPPPVDYEHVLKSRGVAASPVGGVYLLDAETALDFGGLGLLSTIYGKNPSVVLVRDDSDEAFVAAFNKKLPAAAQQIETARTVAEANLKLKTKVTKQIADLGGVDSRAFEFKGALISPTSLDPDGITLKKQLEDNKFVVQIMDEVRFRRMAEAAGIGFYIQLLSEAYSAFTKSA